MIGGQSALYGASSRETGALAGLLRPEVARRLGTDPADWSDPRADAVIATALGCYEAAQIAWPLSNEPPPLATLVDSAMSVIG